MKKIFEEPIVSVEKFAVEDIITTSNLTDPDEGDRV